MFVRPAVVPLHRHEVKLLRVNARHPEEGKYLPVDEVFVDDDGDVGHGFEEGQSHDEGSVELDEFVIEHGGEGVYEGEDGFVEVHHGLWVWVCGMEGIEAR